MASSCAIWKGQRRLPLVLIPVEVHSETKFDDRNSSNQIQGLFGKRVHDQKTVSGVGIVKLEDIHKG